MDDLYKRILTRLEDSRPTALRSVIPGKTGLAADIRRELTDVTALPDGKGRNVAKVTAVPDGGSLVVTEPMLPRERLIVLGGGHVAMPVCAFGAACGFSVFVVDDRSEFANTQRFPAAEEVICDSFASGIRRLAITPFDYVVIVTRGHRFDSDCLRAIIPGVMPAYLGMIGSRRRVRAQMEILKEEGLDPDRLARVCTPIGLNIGAVTPGEIAVSILAEVVAHRRLAEYGGPERICNDSDVELSVLEHIAENDQPMAVATIIETKGSSPRGAGAKMAVDRLGHVTGSVGGGCGEGEVIREALSLIGTGRYKLMELDLTGEAAESDGMVCGGVMTILVEDAVR